MAEGPRTLPVRASACAATANAPAEQQQRAWSTTRYRTEATSRYSGMNRTGSHCASPATTLRRRRRKAGGRSNCRKVKLSRPTQFLTAQNYFPVLRKQSKRQQLSPNRAESIAGAGLQAERAAANWRFEFSKSSSKSRINTPHRRHHAREWDLANPVTLPDFGVRVGAVRNCF
jgi:hypothetical protein